MSKEDPKIYYAENESQPPATFSVVETGDVKPGDKITANHDNWLFEDDSSLGSQLFGLAIIHNAIKSGKNLLMIFNPSDKSEME